MKIRLYLVVVISFFAFSSLFAGQAGWKKEKVQLRLGDGNKITGIFYEPGTRPNFKDKASHTSRKLIRPQRFKLNAKSNNQALDRVFASVIDSPPIDGFVPWIAISATNKNSGSDDFTAVAESTLAGSPLVTDPTHQFAIGLCDTGASAHVIGYDSSLNLGLTGDYISPSITSLGGVSGSVDASVSYPVAIFVAGLGTVDGNTLDTTMLKGQSNVAVAVGCEPVGVPDVATAIGSPMWVFYSTSFNNQNPVTVVYDGNTYTAPRIDIYEHDDPTVPEYGSYIPLELRPLGSTSVQYVPSMEFNENFEFYPSTPSILTGNLSQSLFFVSSVDLTDGSYSAIDRQRFMLDTGAQITVIGSRVASRLGLKPDGAEFEVEITGVTGEITQAPGYYIDSLEIPAFGDWMSFTNIPVVLMDISSPEGGTLDGIIGMNLFLNTNFVLRGGGFTLEADPALYYELIEQSNIVGDISPLGGDGIVDYHDLALLASCWLATNTSTNWDADCDIVPDASGTIINIVDFAAMGSHWLETAN